MLYLIKAHKYKCINNQVDKLDKIQMGHDAEKTLMKEFKAKKASAGDMLDMTSDTHGIRMTVYHSNISPKYRKIIMNKNSAIKSLNSCTKKGLKPLQVLAIAEEDGTFTFFTHGNFESIHWSKMKPWKASKLAVPKKIWNVEKPKSFIAPKKRVVDVELTDAQQQILVEAHKYGDISEWAKSDYNVNRIKDKVDIYKLSQTVDEKIKLCVNRSLKPGSRSYKALMKDGKFKNQFQLGKSATSGAALSPTKGGDRDLWERVLTDGVLHKSPAYRTIKSGDILSASVAKERPLYGYINDRTIERLKGNFGDVTFVLKNSVKKRATMTAWDSSMLKASEIKNAIMHGTSNRSIIQRLIMKKTPSELKLIADGKIAPYKFTWHVNPTQKNNYIETQIYGGIDISKDVEMIVTTKKLDHIKKLANKWGVKYRILPIKETISKGIV